MRLDRFLSKCTHCGRAQATKIIRQGKVKVNNLTSSNPKTQVDPNKDEVLYQDKILEYKEFIYLMLNKPTGYICSTKDNKCRTVLELLEDNYALREPASCGRLDIDTTGLVLLTDNGPWNHKITSPKKKCFKTYIVDSDSPLSKEDMQELREGVLMDNENKKTLPAEIKELAECRYELQICEGKFHQVKRMFQAVGNCVLSLHRAQIGQILLDDKLASGEYRELTNEEVQYFT
jgi:16S rRNA pseudouridine516 synthase